MLMLDRTTGGRGGQTVNVSTYEALDKACSGSEPRIIIVSGKIHHEGRVNCGSNKSIIGKNGAELIGNGFFIKHSKNIIIRNLKISKVKATYGDAIGIQTTSHIWIDHVDVSSDQSHGKDYYDGLIDLTHATDYVTISNSLIHDHFKGCLFGHSDNNSAEDIGHLRITMYGNLVRNVNSRGPSLRFGTAHIFNNVYQNMTTGINVRKGAQVLVEGNYFSGIKEPLFSVDNEGGVVERGNIFGAGAVKVAKSGGRLTSVPYRYQVIPAQEAFSQVSR